MSIKGGGLMFSIEAGIITRRWAVGPKFSTRTWLCNIRSRKQSHALGNYIFMQKQFANVTYHFFFTVCVYRTQYCLPQRLEMNCKHEVCAVIYTQFWEFLHLIIQGLFLNYQNNQLEFGKLQTQTKGEKHRQPRKIHRPSVVGLWKNTIIDN